MLQCSACKNDLPESFFSKKANSKRGYSSKCKKCHADYVKNVWYPKNAEKQKSSSRLWKERNWKQVLSTRYVIPIQNIGDKPEACQICGKTVKLCLDHCHSTNLPRGFLCNSCNIGLGCFEDNEELLQNAINYLKSQRGQEVKSRGS